ncbi:MAG: YqgE/AlgH family protein [Planctomycetales bacterium]|nr:YqgE/AlgH family protein [Planctomycetales bacterium]NIM08894.1 YqgE/AlgH family protein [Planctomycetales bacterium]NIN08354.1 YqgE/AlgH family protein [Planctomycetales bacterium]NIN77482.1 YqgE/AlgH family protein [Planctomycetales bacterium]NIO34654.1 YqgE/AlgH family protein [Planctomycetales bacterium]
MDFLKGKLLIAAPQLADPNFKQTVVLMIEHHEQGAFGVILNRPTQSTVKDLWAELSEGSCHCQQAIHCGGPVTGSLLAVHKQDSLAQAEIMPGIFLAAEREYLDQLVREPAAEFRLFSGYAGWDKGQLEDEMLMGGWITSRATPDYIFDDTANLWSRVNRDITRTVLGAEKNLKHFPDDPSVN